MHILQFNATKWMLINTEKPLTSTAEVCLNDERCLVLLESILTPYDTFKIIAFIITTINLLFRLVTLQLCLPWRPCRGRQLFPSSSTFCGRASWLQRLSSSPRVLAPDSVPRAEWQRSYWPQPPGVPWHSPACSCTDDSALSSPGDAAANAQFTINAAQLHVTKLPTKPREAR